MDTRDDLRDELIAMLSAARELSPVTDAHLAETFMERMAEQPPVQVRATRQATRRTKEQLTHVRHGFTGLLAISLLAPAVAVAVSVPADSIARRLDAGALPAYYDMALILMTVCILLTMYLEHHAVEVRISARPKNRRSSAGRV